MALSRIGEAPRRPVEEATVNRLSTIAAKIGLGAALVVLWFLTALTATAMFIASIILIGIFLIAPAHAYLELL